MLRNLIALAKKEKRTNLIRFKYGAILLVTVGHSHSTVITDGNLLGEAILTHRANFNFTYHPSGIVLPLLKRNSSGDIWQDASIFLGLPRIITLSLFGYSEINWGSLQKKCFKNIEASNAQKRILACKKYWISQGFIPAIPGPILSTEEVQRHNIVTYLNLPLKAKQELKTITQKTLIGDNF